MFRKPRYLRHRIKLSLNSCNAVFKMFHRLGFMIFLQSNKLLKSRSVSLSHDFINGVGLNEINVSNL